MTCSTALLIAFPFALISLTPYPVANTFFVKAYPWLKMFQNVREWCEGR